MDTVLRALHIINKLMLYHSEDTLLKWFESYSILSYPVSYILYKEDFKMRYLVAVIIKRKTPVSILGFDLIAESHNPEKKISVRL